MRTLACAIVYLDKRPISTLPWDDTRRLRPLHCVCRRDADRKKGTREGKREETCLGTGVGPTKGNRNGYRDAVAWGDNCDVSQIRMQIGINLIGRAAGQHAGLPSPQISSVWYRQVVAEHNCVTQVSVSTCDRSGTS